MKIDLHIHTVLSPDSPASAEEMISAAKAAGLDGIALTNHDVLTDFEVSDDFTIISACEYTTDAGHILTYFLNEDISAGIEKDSKGRFPWKPIVDKAHEKGALVFLAHPFAPEPPNRDVAVFDEIDGIEIYNARIEHSRSKGANRKAQQIAREKNLAFSAGSDGHFPSEAGSAYWECDTDDIYTALKLGKGRVYGGTASPMWRVYSQWIKMYRLKAWSYIPRLIPRTLRGFFLSFLPKRKPEKIDFPERNEI